MSTLELQAACMTRHLDKIPRTTENIPFHPTHTNTQKESIDFLDLTIYQGPHFQSTNRLDTKTFQKPRNVYQYLHFTSCHQKNIHKAIIIGECVRYVRSNMSKEKYNRIWFNSSKPGFMYIYNNSSHNGITLLPNLYFPEYTSLIRTQWSPAVIPVIQPVHMHSLHESHQFKYMLYTC